MLAEEFAVSAAAVHQVGIEFPPELGPGLGNEAGEVGDSVKKVTEAWEVIPGDLTVAVLATLGNFQEVSASSRDEEGGAGIGGLFIDQILDEIEEFAGLIANFPQKPEIVF